MCSRFVNAAFNMSVEATNTCGLLGPTEYCLLNGLRSCGHICDASSQRDQHHPRFMTDFNIYNKPTWWQSETMARQPDWLGRQQHVNLTLSLGKAFDITYIRLRFHSARPESFAIYKRTSEDEEWEAYQYYSASCYSTYGLEFQQEIKSDMQDVATCTDEFSDISPLTGGEVPFSTLEGRPDAVNFESSQVLQEWVTASDIRIELTRLNTFGDELFGDSNVLQSYFYAIDDLAIGARCKCNGHANSCELGPDSIMSCNCKHNTAGQDCNICLPFYNDRPWARATNEDGMECLPCDCNGQSNECYFDEELYKETGHGGHCTNCQDNKDGINCEKCLPNHYVDPRSNRCTACHCDETGSKDLQCDVFGHCKCKAGVVGQRCDRCEDNFYDFGIYGCRACGCVEEGSLNNYPLCDSATGACVCKAFVRGQNCDRCKPGYFGLELENPYGCISCFCFGHSSICTSASGYTPSSIFTDFETGKQGWIGVDRRYNKIDTQYNNIQQLLGISAPQNNGIIYFSAPARYLGDQRFSYNQFLTFKLRIGEKNASPSIIDIAIEGAGRRISTPCYTQGNPQPSIQTQEYSYRLNEHPKYEWYPRMDSEAFLTILSNVTAIKIRAVYNKEGVGFIDDIRLDTAKRGFNEYKEVSWVESCTCSAGYVGQFCESCAPGYNRDPLNGGPFASCVPCESNEHSEQCDTESDRPDIVIELVDGQSSNEGRVELVKGGVRGTVCDHGWDDKDAAVVCNMLGYNRGTARNDAHYGPGYEHGRIWLENVACTGSESSLSECQHSGWGNSNCGHEDDAGVVCSYTDRTDQGLDIEDTWKEIQCGNRPLESDSRKRREVNDSEIGPPLIGRIVGGFLASKGFYPWQVGVRRKYGTNPPRTKHRCGGTILSEYWILSAAHCFKNIHKSQILLRTGDYNNTHPDDHEQEFEVDVLIKHPDFNGSIYDFDVALIKIKPVDGRGINFTDYVQPACLPNEDTQYGKGHMCHISGWGFDKKRSTQNLLKAAEVPLIADTTCKQLYRSHQITSNMVCAGYKTGGIDTCKGDSGGPLVCEVNGRYTVMGVTSFGKGCAKNKFPGVYAKVKSVLPWINEHMGNCTIPDVGNATIYAMHSMIPLSWGHQLSTGERMLVACEAPFSDTYKLIQCRHGVWSKRIPEQCFKEADECKATVEHGKMEFSVKCEEGYSVNVPELSNEFIYHAGSLVTKDSERQVKCLPSGSRP